MTRRLWTARGEADLVCREGRTLVVVEVKSARRRGRFRPGDRMTPRRLGRLRALADDLARRTGSERARVDLVEVVLDVGGARSIPGGAPSIRWTRDLGSDGRWRSRALELP